MTEPYDPLVWDDIAKEQASIGSVVRRVVPSLRHDVFVGEHRPGRERLLILDLHEVAVGLPRKRPASMGLNMTVEAINQETTRIRLTSTTPQGNSIFQELAADVVGVLADAPDEGAALRVVERVLAWQAFLAQRPDDFSSDKAAGLYAELCVLAEAFIPRLGAVGGTVAWTGPDPALQDFQLSDGAVEVKSFRGVGPGHLNISSERQLDSTGIQSLLVAYIRLDQRSQGSGDTLAEKIQSVRSQLGDSLFSQTAFDTKILSSGWHSSYSQIRDEKYEVLSKEIFGVTEGFPRLVPAMLPLGVGHVAYRIDRAALDDFLVPWEQFLAQLQELR